jgi:hypothetical protein
MPLSLFEKRLSTKTETSGEVWKSSVNDRFTDISAIQDEAAVHVEMNLMELCWFFCGGALSYFLI